MTHFSITDLVEDSTSPHNNRTQQWEYPWDSSLTQHQEGVYSCLSGSTHLNEDDSKIKTIVCTWENKRVSWIGYRRDRSTNLISTLSRLCDHEYWMIRFIHDNNYYGGCPEQTEVLKENVTCMWDQVTLVFFLLCLFIILITFSWRLKKTEDWRQFTSFKFSLSFDLS